jgi:hypothetical protein
LEPSIVVRTTGPESLAALPGVVSRTGTEPCRDRNRSTF